jgi:hypothetical protein
VVRRIRSVVVDTNVPVVANGASPQASPVCVSRCRERIVRVTKGRERLVLDDHFAVFNEYRSRLSLSGQPGVGDMFLRWVHDNQFNASRCERVAVTRHPDRGYVEFPDDPRLAGFDPSDRKFVAVSAVSPHAPPILNAVDSDWWDHELALARHGIKVVHLCDDQALDWSRSRARL